MATVLRDEFGQPFTTGEFVGPTPQALLVDYLAQAGAVSGVPFHVVEIEAFQPASGAVSWPLSFGLVPWGVLSLTPAPEATTTTIRASDAGYRTKHSDAGGVQPYRATISGSIPINREIDLDPAIVAAAISWGQISLFNDDGQYDGQFSTFSVSGRSAKLYRGTKTWEDSPRGIWLDPAYADLVLLFAGVSQAWAMDVNTLAIKVRDASFWLERPYQQNTYGGAGAYDGDASLAGTRIPRTRGGTASHPVENVTPVLIDQANLIYQYNDGPGTVVNLYEGAATVFDPSDGDTSDLYTGAPTAGHYRTDNSRGLFQLASAPVHAITADVTGEFPTAGAKTNWADIARYIITEDMALSTTFVDTTSFSDAATNYAYTAGVYFGPDDNVDGVKAACRLIGAVGAKLIDGRDGKLQCFVLRALAGTETPALTITTANCSSVSPVAMPAALDPPPYRVRVAWNHNWTIQNGDFDGIAAASRQQFVASPDTYAVAANASITAAYAQPNDLAPFGGALLVSTDADAVASAVGALWSTKRYLFDVTLPTSLAIALDIGSVVRLIWPMSVLRNGALGQIVGERYETGAPSITFRVLV